MGAGEGPEEAKAPAAEEDPARSEYTSQLLAAKERALKKRKTSDRHKTGEDEEKKS
jgi:hypothetical protein